MKTHTLVFRQIDRANFTAIKDGLKTVETRAATVRHRDIKAGDTLVIKCGKDSTIKTVQDVRHFASIDDLLRAIPIQNVMPFATTKAGVEREYYSCPGYKEKIEQHGIIALTLN